MHFPTCFMLYFGPVFYLFFVFFSQVSAITDTQNGTKFNEEKRGLNETNQNKKSNTVMLAVVNASNEAIYNDMISTSSTTEMSVNTNDSDTVKCNNSDELEIYRNPENCSEYFMACVRPSPQASPSLLVSLKFPVLKEQYGTILKSCSEGFLFDGIEKLCLPAEQVKCGETFEALCSNADIFHKDPVHPSQFIECLNGTIKRQECQPKGTIFNEISQMCEKVSHRQEQPAKPQNDANSEPFSLTLLRVLTWIVSKTDDKFSPWMERVKLHPNEVTFPHETTNSSIVDYVDQGVTYSSDHVGEYRNLSHLTFGDYNKNTSILESNTEDDDELLVLTDDTGYLVLYYGVMAGAALLMIVSWILVALLCSKLFSLCDNEEDYEEDSAGEFYRYSQNDKYVMTRL